MKQHLITAIIAIVAIALALGFFFAGFFVRGWVDRELSIADLKSVGQDTSAKIANTPDASPTLDANNPMDIDDDPSRGPGNAPVTIIEFSDYQCPFCKRYVEETLPLIFDSYGDNVHYVFHDFPIEQLHPQAVLAAQAAQCALDQGKFWEYHDLLFRNQGALGVDNLKEYAAKLSLDQAMFDGCLDSGKYAQEVQDDFEEASAHGVTATPTFFINGRKIVGAQSFADFQTIIEQELQKTGTQ